MLKLLLSGSAGRMGHQVTALAEEYNAQILCGVDVHVDDTLPFPVYPAFSLVTEKPDVIVDFSRPEGLDALLDFALQNRTPVLLAATGYNEENLRRIADASKSVPIFRSANLSLGVYVLKTLSAKAAMLLRDYDVEIVEKHHNQKLDAPSGTALMLYDVVKAPESVPVYGRHTRTEKRQQREIGMHAVRGGTVAGQHEVGFYGPGETLLLTHTAQDRSIFAVGALRAAHYIVSCPPGEYDMNHLAQSLLASSDK